MDLLACGVIAIAAGAKSSAWASLPPSPPRARPRPLGRCGGRYFSSDLLVGLRLRGAAGGLSQCANDAAPRQVDLEGIVLITPGVAQQQIGGAPKTGLVGSLSAQRCFGQHVTPWLVRDTAERKTRLLDGIVLEFQCSRDRDQRECVGEPIADLQIGIVCGEPLRG